MVGRMIIAFKIFIQSLLVKCYLAKLVKSSKESVRTVLLALYSFFAFRYILEHNCLNLFFAGIALQSCR